jgi:hypothetical protein
VIDNQFGKWIHPAFSATSMAYFFTILDKTDLIASSFILQGATLCFATALILNGVWAWSYYSNEDSSPYLSNIIKSNFFAKGFHNLARNSFFFGVIALLWYVLDRSITIDWLSSVL